MQIILETWKNTIRMYFALSSVFIKIFTYFRQNLIRLSFFAKFLLDL